MPRLENCHRLVGTNLWEGRCPAPGCSRWFRVEADSGQPRWHVLKSLNSIRPEGLHVHGSHWVYEHVERGGDI